MKRNFTIVTFTFIVMAFFSLSLKADNVVKVDITTAGTLETLLGANKNSVTDLTITGKINGTDINTLRDLITNQSLASLNIAKVIIIGGTTYKDKYNGTWTTVENEITDNMFHQLPNLTKMVLPNKVTKIGTRAFNNTGLIHLTIPANVTEIGAGAFYYNPNLVEIHCLATTAPTLGATALGQINTTCTLYIPYGAIAKYGAGWSTFTNKVEENPSKAETISKTVSLTSAGSLSAQLSENDMRDITDLTISGNINGTDIKAIREMEDLYVLNIKSARIVAGGDAYYEGKYTSDDIVPASAFFGLVKLTSIELPASITKIDESAFYNCSSLSSINLPANVTEIEGHAFSRCYTLEIPILSSNITKIGDYAFADNYVTETVNIPNSVSVLGNSAFRSIRKLTTLTIGTGVTVLETSAFSDCALLTDVTIGENVTELGDNLFNGCTSLESITFPEKLTKINGSAFMGCSALKTVSLGSNVINIGAGAFFDCTNLESIYSKTLTPPSITFNTFHNVPVGTCKLFVPANAISAYNTTAYWKEFNIQDITTGVSFDKESLLEVSKTVEGISISVPTPTAIVVYDLSGKVVYKSYINSTSNISLGKGAYLIKADNEVQKIVL